MEERPIRVLSVDDSALVRRVIAQILQVQPDMELVAEAATGGDAIRLAAELQPDVVLMDLHLPDMDGIQATSQVSTQLKHGAVITVTAEETPAILAQVEAAGSRGVVLKPLGDGDELLRVMREVHAQQLERQLAAEIASAEGSAQRRGRCIAVVGAKGGVGKTTIAIGLALALQRHPDTQTILVDADFPFGDVNVQLDLPAERSILDLAGRSASLDSYLVGQAIRNHHTGVHVLARPPRPEEADIVTPDDVRASLGVLPGMYDFVVVDTAASYDEKTLAVLDTADAFVMVLTPHLGALQNAHHFLDLAKVLGYPVDRMCFVLNRANALAGLTLDLIGEVVGTKEILRVPSGGAAVSEAINRGQPLSITRPESPFSRAVDSVATHVRSLALGEKNEVRR